MDRIDTLRLLIRVIERRSFTAAASDLNIPRSTATEAIKQLEARLGVRLLDRTTRHVQPTVDGVEYHDRIVAILADIEEADASFSRVQPQGLLRIDVHGHMARHFLLPKLSTFLERYPGINLHIGEGDRLVDLVREGVDCVIRAGDLGESGMVGRRIGLLPELTCASPTYLATRGVPRDLDDLRGHEMVGFLSSKTGGVMPLEFMVDGVQRVVNLPHRITVNGSDTMAELARLGFGLIQAPRYRFEHDLAQGTLVEVMASCPPAPTPVTILYPQNRQTSPRLRVFLDWAIATFVNH